MSADTQKSPHGTEKRPMLLRRAITYQLGPLFPAEREDVVALVPLPKRRGVDDDDRVLHQGLGAHQLVVAGVVHDVDDASPAGASFGSPGEVPVIEAQGPVLYVSAPRANVVHPARPQLGVRSRTSQLELPLLAEGLPLAAGGPPLVPVVATYTCSPNT